MNVNNPIETKTTSQQVPNNANLMGMLNSSMNNQYMYPNSLMNQNLQSIQNMMASPQLQQSQNLLGNFYNPNGYGSLLPSKDNQVGDIMRLQENMKYIAHYIQPQFTPNNGFNISDEDLIHPPKNMNAYIDLLHIMPYSDDAYVPTLDVDLDGDQLASFNANLSTDGLVLSAPDPQSITVNIEWNIPSLQYKKRPAMDIVLVIEKSSFMKKHNFGIVREAVNRLLEHTEDHDRISVVLFDDFGYRSTALSLMVEDGQDVVRNTVYNLFLCGGRDLIDGIGQGLEILRQRKYRNPLTSIFVISNTDSISSIKDVEFLVKSYDNLCVLNIFGYAPGHNKTLFQQIADVAAGNYYDCENKESLIKSVESAWKELTNLIAYRNETRFVFNERFSPKVTLTEETGKFVVIEEAQFSYRMDLPPLYNNSKLKFSIILDIPAKIACNDDKSSELLFSMEFRLYGVYHIFSFNRDVSVSTIHSEFCENVTENPKDKFGKMMEEVRSLILQNKSKEAQALMEIIREEMSRIATN